MHLHQLKYFVAIVETGSVTGAANRCHISQPAISQQLRKLEHSVGKDLFFRVKGKLVLTDAGQVMFDQARRILAQVEDARHRVGSLNDASGGTLAIGVLPTLAPFILPHTLTALSEEFPAAMVSVREEVSESIVDAIGRGELDVIIDVQPFDERNLIVERLFSDEFYVAVHRDSALAELDVVPIDALEGLPFILLEDIHCLARQIEQYCVRKRFMPKVLFQASQLATVKQLVEMQYGVSLLPSISIDKDADSTIRYIELEGEAPSREVVYATGEGRYLDPAAEFFLSTLRGRFGQSD